MMKSSASKSLKDSGSPSPPLESSFRTLALTPPIPNVTVAQVSVTTGSPAPYTPVLPVGNRCQAMLHIIVWQPNVISIINGDTQMRYAIFGSVEDVTPWDMWLITVQSTCLPNQKLATLMKEPILTTMTSTPLWMTTREMVCVEPGAQIYEGGNVTISFLYHVFFLISVIRRPYFSFAPSYQETDRYLLAFLSYSSPLILPL